MILDELADVRTGDKGSDLTVAVLPRTPEKYAHLTQVLTEERVAAHYGLDATDVSRVTLPATHAMVFHLRGILGGGVTGSSYLDGHGKTMGYHLLTCPLPALPSV